EVNGSFPLCHIFQELLWPPAGTEGLTGYLVRVIPPNACHAIENPPAPRKASETYIALIQGYDCSYVKKVLHAQQAGYQTAVVYNVASEQVITMTADDKEIQQLIKIPSLFTGQSVSLHLEISPVLSFSSCSRLVFIGKQLTLQLSLPSPGPHNLKKA
uniref:PA domain-containing protein n=1 Tax=Buteo japonicus TaxID=224669 RepID=A0A8B9Z005_9AVES